MQEFRFIRRYCGGDAAGCVPWRVSLARARRYMRRRRRSDLVLARRPTTAALAVVLALVLAGAAGVGCIGRESPSLKSNDPTRKIPAIKQAVEQHDDSAVPELIKALSSEDPAIRFYAIQGLERMTGQTLGYRFYDSDHERAQAVRRWKRWYDGGATTEPSPAPPPTSSEASREQ
jgi:hypothetical protein